MLVSHPMPAQTQVPRPRAGDVVEFMGRERGFACPTGLHDFCSSDARHDLPVQDGLSG